MRQCAANFVHRKMFQALLSVKKSKMSIKTFVQNISAKSLTKINIYQKICFYNLKSVTNLLR